MPPGTGTLINVAAILIGSALGAAVGQRLPQRTRDVVTDGLGLITLMVAGFAIIEVASDALREDVGSWAFLIVLGAVMIGGILGATLGIEQRLADLGQRLQDRFASSGNSVAEGFVTASLVFCVGPLAILGSISDGVGNGIDQLALKSVMDGFASVAFAASLGWGVGLSAISVGLYQGLLTAMGFILGDVLPPSALAAMTATGGLLLAGVGLRILRIRDVAVGDLLPAIAVAPMLVLLLSWVRG